MKLLKAVNYLQDKETLFIVFVTIAKILRQVSGIIIFQTSDQCPLKDDQFMAGKRELETYLEARPVTRNKFHHRHGYYN